MDKTIRPTTRHHFLEHTGPESPSGTLGMSTHEMDDPLEFIDFVDILQHGDPSKWKSKGEKPGSGTLAHSSDAPPGTKKIYEIYEDEFGDEIEVHYFRHPDGCASGVKVTPRS